MSLLDDVSIVLTPNGYKAGELYAVIPSDGTADMDVTRATDATRVDENGLIENVLSNVPRIDYTGGGCPHILAEPQRTNLWKNSEGSAITLTSPLGTFDFYNITSSSVNDNSVITAGTIVSATFIVKKADGTTPTITSGSGSGDVIFRITGTSGAGNAGALTDIGNGFYTFKLENYSVSGNNSDNRISNNSGDVVYVSLIQLEEGSYSTSYIPTSGSAVTRNKDQFSRDGIGSLINSSEGVLFVEMAALTDDTSFRAMSISDGTTSNRITLVYNGGIRVFNVVGGSISSNINYTTTITTTQKIAILWSSTSFKLWVNGVERGVISGVSIASNTLNKLSLDQGNGVHNMFAKVKQLQVYDTALTDTQLAALTS